MKFEWTDYEKVNRGGPHHSACKFVWINALERISASVRYDGDCYSWVASKYTFTPEQVKLQRGAGVRTVLKRGREIDRTTAKREAELWLRQNVL